MILPCHGIGWVRADDGRAVAFDVTRLSASIIRAATLAGHGDWWLADAVAEAVREFVCAHCDRETVDTGMLADLVMGVLVALGYSGIAEAYRRRREYAEIQLDQITRESHAATELEFFHQLDAALHVAGDKRLVHVQVRGLRTCVMRLRGAQHWSANCRRLADEILDHVRQRVAKSRPRDAADLRLAVVE